MKINLFFFISKFNYGGAGNAIFNFLKNLNSKKFDLHIIFLGKSDYKKQIPTNVKIYELNDNFILFKTFFCFFQIRKILVQNIFSNKKNIFISNIHYSNVLSILFLRKIKNLKIILFERTSLSELDVFQNFTLNFKNKIIKFLIKYTYIKADKVLANSKILVSELKKFNVKSSVIYSGSIKTVLKRKKKKKKNFVKIIAVGRLTPQKDYFTLLKAIKISKKKKFILKIYGKGELKKILTKYIRNNNLTKKIILAGHQKSQAKIYADADLLIHTAIYEGLPNAVVEAMNYGIPVIAANSYGGTREVLKSGKFGGLFKPKNSNELSKMLENFLTNPNELNKKVLKSKSFLNKFTQRNSAKSLEKILMSI